jgi:hypothetical protein
MNIVLNIKTDSAFQIKFNTPIAQLIPFKRDSDFGEIIFEDESNFKYVSTRGFGLGHLAPGTGTSVLYRAETTRVDVELKNNKKNKRFSKEG